MHYSHFLALGLLSLPSTFALPASGLSVAIPLDGLASIVQRDGGPVGGMPGCAARMEDTDRMCGELSDMQCVTSARVWWDRRQAILVSFSPPTSCDY
jgi:hypothetical protein